MILAAKTLLILVATALSPFTVQAVTLVESSCLMRLTFPTNQTVTLETAYQIETITATYLDTLLITNIKVLPSDIYPLKFHVDVADRIVFGSTATVTAMVTLLYEASETAKPLEMASILMQALEQANDISTRNFTFTSYSSKAVLSFDAVAKNSTILDQLSDDSGDSTTEVGLIVVTAFLSAMLVIVSSVLLFITGGWKTCMTKVTNCLFEEVDEEEYVVAQKSTYPIQVSEDEEESNITSLPPSSASGILGVARNRDRPAPGLVMSLEDDDDESSMLYGDGMTPVSHHNNQEPLGITSMRKLQQSGSPEVRGGLSGIVMQRLMRSSGKKK